MFQASLCPSSGALDRILMHMVYRTWYPGRCLGKPGSRSCTVDTACFIIIVESSWFRTPFHINRLTPNDHCSCTAPLTSKRFILYIYSTNTGTEYFKHGIYFPFSSSKCSLFHNSNICDSCIIHILYTECTKI